MNDNKQLLVSFIKDEMSRLSQQESVCTEQLNKGAFDQSYYILEIQRIAWRKDSLLRQLERLL